LLNVTKLKFKNLFFPHKVKGFFSSLKENGSQLRCVQQTIETIEENIRWMDKNFDKIRLWLQSEKLALL
jgi:adipocyte-derived leucine aminopeptidase